MTKPRAVSLPRESVEYVRLSMEVDGVPVTTGVEVAITAQGQRPETWTTAADVDGPVVLIGVDPYDLAPGSWTVWGRYTDAPEIPVTRLGVLIID